MKSSISALLALAAVSLLPTRVSAAPPVGGEPSLEKLSRDEAVQTLLDDARMEWENSSQVDRVAATAQDISPFQYTESPLFGTPLALGGPGMAVQGFDTSDGPLALVEELLARYNFLSVGDVRAELRVWSDVSELATRTVILQQLVRGLPIFESRLVFIFDHSGAFRSYAGQYFPPEWDEGRPHVKDCLSFFGATDGQGNTIVECTPYLSYDARRTGAFDGELVPIYEVIGEAPAGYPVQSFYSDATQEFHSVVHFDTAGDRLIRSGTPHDNCGSWYTYRLNEYCQIGSCTDANLDRQADDLWLLTFYMDLYHDRLSYDQAGSDWIVYTCPWETGAEAMGSYVKLDFDTRRSVLVHEFTHNWVGHHVPGTNDWIKEGLSDTYANIIQGQTNHWCFHNYPGDPDEPCDNPTHYVQRCTMLAGDTVREIPSIYAYSPYIEANVPGTLFNVRADDHHAAASVYTKAFELFQRSYTDPNDPNQHYFNGSLIQRSVAFSKVADVFYRFITNHLAGVGSHPWSTFGHAFTNAAYYSYLNGEISYDDLQEARRAAYAVGHRPAAQTISYHTGTVLRPAAFMRGDTLFLFYVRSSDEKIVYQKLTGTTWTAPVAISSAAAISSHGLDAYTLPSGDVRVIFRHKTSGNVYYVWVSSSGTVYDAVYSLPCAGVTSVYAPAGIHDGTYQKILTSHGTYVRTWNIDLCTHQDTLTSGEMRGISATKFRGNVYAVITYKKTGIVWKDRQMIYKLVGFQLNSIGGTLDFGAIRCDNYFAGSSGCYSFVQTGDETPNIYGVTLSGDRQPFERMYVGFTNSTNDFKLHRLSINAADGKPWNRTRILPVDSGDTAHKNEVELVQHGNRLLVFEGSKMHTIYLYY